MNARTPAPAKLVNSTLIVFLLGQLIFALIWAVHQEARITALEVENKAQAARIDTMDNAGTRAMVVVEDRQKQVISTANRLSDRLDRLADRVTDISRYLQPTTKMPPP